MALALAATAPASAVQLEDLGIDLGSIFGKGGGDGLDGLALAERILERELPKRIAPARRWQVKLDRKGSDLLGGRLSKVQGTGTDVETDDGPLIPDMGLNLEGVKLALGSRTIQSVSKNDFTAGLGGAAVTSFIRKRAGARVRDVSVAFRDGQLAVKGTPELLGFGLPSEVAGKPVLTGDDAIDFNANRVSVLGFRVPRFAVEQLEKKVNPVVDLSGLKLPVKITDIGIRGERLTAQGRLSFER
jgi:hypothetical protein